MPEFPGTLKPPRLATAPSSPALGQMYYDTATNRLFWWNGTLWVVAGSAAAASYAQTIGDGSTTSFTINHALGTSDVFVSVREASGNLSIVYPEVQVTDANNVKVIFDVAPASNAYRVFVTQGVGAPPAYVTTLPGSPYDGQEVYLQVDATNGINWHFRYRAGSASAYKWEFLGGPPLDSRVDALEISTSTTYVDLTTAGPSVTVPRAGDYELSFGCFPFNGEANEYVRMSPRIGSTAPVDADSATLYGQVSGQSGSAIARTIVKTCAASDLIKCQYLGTVAGGTNFNAAWRWLSVIPVRVS